jgi:hypothetical protein
MRLRSADITFRKSVIEADGFGKKFDAGVGLLLKPSAPGFGGHGPGPFFKRV